MGKTDSQSTALLTHQRRLTDAEQGRNHRTNVTSPVTTSVTPSMYSTSAV